MDEGRKPQRITRTARNPVRLRRHDLGMLGPGFLAKAFAEPGDGVGPPAVDVVPALEALEGVAPGVQGEEHQHPRCVKVLTSPTA